MSVAIYNRLKESCTFCVSCEVKTLSFMRTYVPFRIILILKLTSLRVENYEMKGLNVIRSRLCQLSRKRVAYVLPQESKPNFIEISKSQNYFRYFNISMDVYVWC